MSSGRLWWTLPSLFCLVLYWYGLKCWFAQDDFAWLALHFDVPDWNGFLRNMFTPMAQGTIRFLSERGFFLLFYWLFGMDALPYRIFVFATQFANLALLASITWRLTGSRLAGFAAPVLWVANSALVTPMSWSSCYNQILCSFFLLLSFHLFLRHIETGRWRYYWWQWAAFLAGFGALELNVVYPALAFSYAVLCARRHVVKTLPMVGASVLYAALHYYVTPASTGVYSMYWDRSIFRTLRTYTEWAMGTARLDVIGFQRMMLADCRGVGTDSGAVGFRRVENLPAGVPGAVLCFLVCAGARAATASTRPHVELLSDDSGYRTGDAGGRGRLRKRARSGVAIRIVSVGLAAMYLAASIPVARAETRWHYNRSHAVRDLTLGVARARELHPSEALVISGVSSETFWATFPDHAFRTVGVENIFVAPGADQQQLLTSIRR